MSAFRAKRTSRERRKRADPMKRPTADGKAARELGCDEDEGRFQIMERIGDPVSGGSVPI